MPSKALMTSCLCMDLAFASRFAFANQIYSCVDAHGNRHVSDRVILECRDREHKVLSPDGSTRKILPVPLTMREQAEKAAQKEQEADKAAEKQELIRRDMAMLKKFPNQESHDAARRSTLEIPQSMIKTLKARLAALNEQKKALTAEAGKQAGQALAPELQGKIVANTAAIRAQEEFLQVHQNEVDRLNFRFDQELIHLQTLWSHYSSAASSTPQAPTPSPR